MEITIDTTKDSVDEIKKTIDFLKNLIGHDEPELLQVDEGIFNIFENAESTTREEVMEEDDIPAPPEDVKIMLYDDI